jgi:hypothetical protein
MINDHNWSSQTTNTVDIRTNICREFIPRPIFLLLQIFLPQSMACGLTNLADFSANILYLVPIFTVVSIGMMGMIK